MSPQKSRNQIVPGVPLYYEWSVIDRTVMRSYGVSGYVPVNRTLPSTTASGSGVPLLRVMGLMPPVGVLGLGFPGSPYARHPRDEGFRTYVYASGKRPGL